MIYIVRGRRDIKYGNSRVFMQATRPRARACIFHKTLSLMLYLLHTYVQCT